MEFRVKQIRKKAKLDYEVAWLETAKLLQKTGRKNNWQKVKGKTHSLIETILKFREVFLSLGLEEMILPSLVAKNEVYRQYGPEAKSILKRIFHLRTGDLTLRSHMTAAWFPALAKLQRKRQLPLKLFSIGNRYRKEQRQTNHHLYVSTSASIVIMSKEITLKDGVELTKKILREMGFKSIKVVIKKIASKYYAPEMDLEVFIKYKGKQIEVANLGFYSPVSLANYKIWYPVLNIGFGVERISMIKNKQTDIRKLVYGEVA